MVVIHKYMTAWANILPIELHTYMYMETDVLQVILGMLIHLVEE